MVLNERMKYDVLFFPSDSCIETVSNAKHLQLEICQVKTLFSQKSHADQLYIIEEPSSGRHMAEHNVDPQLVFTFQRPRQSIVDL